MKNTPHLKINTNPADYNPDWAAHLYGAYGSQGVIATAWWMGSLMADDIRASHRSYPFFELIGAHGDGKSGLLAFLWKLLGSGNYEGFVPSWATADARDNHFHDPRNIPIVLLDIADIFPVSEVNAFDLDALKPAYNGNSVWHWHHKPGDAHLYSMKPKHEFHGAILFSQNTPLDVHEMLRSRIVQIVMSNEQHTEESYRHWHWLHTVEVDYVSGFTCMINQLKPQLMALFNAKLESNKEFLFSPFCKHSLRKYINYGQVMTLLDCMGNKGLRVFPDSIIDRAKLDLRSLFIGDDLKAIGTTKRAAE